MSTMLSRSVGSIARRFAAPLARALHRQAAAIDANRMLLAQLHARRVAALPDRLPLREAEFGAYSQFGEDGIIEYLVTHVDVGREMFVEFGVENYVESNTRFLLRHRNWKGLVLDGSEAHVQYIRSDDLWWRHDLSAVAAFITAENIDGLLAEHGASGDVGLLSVDIDGNDYWVWKAITSLSPRIVVCEYNSMFGHRHPIVVPYRPDFDRTRAHHSWLYYGASIAALCRLAEEKGYAFVGCGSAGINAFFVRRDCMQRLRELTPAEGYVESRVRESRDRDGRQTFLAGEARARAMGECLVHHVDSGRPVPLADLFPLT